MQTSTIKLLSICIFWLAFHPPTGMLLAYQENPIESVDSEIQFSRDILPILSDACFPCHGPDANSREADLRLDRRLDLLGVDQQGGVVVPGEPNESELVYRISSSDDYERMPPPESVVQLSDSQIALIRQWIEEGAVWQSHWSFAPIDSPQPPNARAAGNHTASIDLRAWPQNAIDSFVLARLLDEQLSPSPEAERARLLRRVTLDLTGIPPTLSELDAFLADTDANAYERVVDRLLASPRYGERMSWAWLDAARYADTNGFQGDNERTMWPWRDWLIDTLNSGMSFDEFTRDQLAGDLLPNPTFEQKLATGFARNHMINGEGGRIAEENRVEYIFDQLETVGTVWLGMTYQCCRCHDHKYDHLTQENYFELFAFFNRTSINGAGGNAQTPPVITAPSSSQRRALEQVANEIMLLDRRLGELREAVASEFPAWLQSQRESATQSTWSIPPIASAEAVHQQLSRLPDRSILATDSRPTPNDDYVVEFSEVPEDTVAIHLEALQDPSLTGSGLSRAGSGNFVLTSFEVEVIRESSTEPQSIERGIASYEQNGLSIEGAFDDNPSTGWAVWSGSAVNRPHAAVFYLESPITLEPGERLRITLRHESPHVSHNLGRFRIALSSSADATLAQDTLPSLALLNIPEGELSATQLEQLRDSQLKDSSHFQELSALRKQQFERREQILSQSPKVMVMQDAVFDRATFVLDKGLYNQPLQEVTPNLPPISFASERTDDLTRLELANWILSPQNPLTARVTVNRMWQTFFGTGLIATSEDFGTQGERPSHPELLDWLAKEFIISGWNVKHMHRLIVTSSTYRQSAVATAQSWADDPKNRRLGRGPRSRMPSWMIRDAALASSGLLVEQLGGPPVSPYQPAGVWSEATFGKKRYEVDSGRDLYRRSVYTFWRRIVGPTMFFDVAKRQTCTVRPSATNTPLHALVTLNDTTYVEAARVMAQSLIAQEDDDFARARLAFRIVTSREPNEEEQSVLRERLQQLQAFYQDNPAESQAIVGHGDYEIDMHSNASELASLSGLCLLILNLDESLSR